jgi:hypothetical protein
LLVVQDIKDISLWAKRCCDAKALVDDAHDKYYEDGNLWTALGKRRREEENEAAVAAHLLAPLTVLELHPANLNVLTPAEERVWNKRDVKAL